METSGVWHHFFSIISIKVFLRLEGCFHIVTAENIPIVPEPDNPGVGIRKKILGPFYKGPFFCSA